MQINNNKPSFKANLSKNIIDITYKLNTKSIEDAFVFNYGIDAKFNNDKALTTCFTLTLNLFESLSEKAPIFRFITPPRIRVFKKHNLTNFPVADEFCITDTQKVLIEEPPFELRSIFAKQMLSLEKIDKKSDFLYQQNIISSPHFLANYIHEWSHNLHIHEILKKHGYEGNCHFAKDNYKTINAKGLAIINKWSTYPLNTSLKETAQNFIGIYSSKSIMEFFAETMTKLITSSLNKNYNLKSNPLDNLKKFPPILKKFFENIIDESFQ